MKKEMMSLSKSLALGAAWAALITCSAAAQVISPVVATAGPDAALEGRAAAAGGRDLAVISRDDGGILISGLLDGRAFAVAIPKGWNHQALVFAHGYSTPDSTLDIAKDPIANDPAGGLLAAAYADKLAVGHSAFDKAGLGVETGAKATLRLAQFLQALGATRSYVSGGSMGGSIVMSLIEQHPDMFVGALSVCGVTDSFEDEVAMVIDMRALYNVFTEGTPYALPGEKDINRSAVATLPPVGAAVGVKGFQLQQTIKVARPILKLFADARLQPEGRAAGIVRKIASVTGQSPEVASFIFPLVTAAMGMDDIKSTAGGQVYSNRSKHYAGTALTDAETADLNKSVQRIDADPTAVRYIRHWHTSTGVFKTLLVALHNQIDPLVPYGQALGLEGKIFAHGNPRLFTLITASPASTPIPGAGVQGYTHCGFDPTQIADAWKTLRRATGG